MRTKVTFKALRDGKVIYKTLSIEHPEFKEIPSEEFKGFKFHSVSVGSQVIDYLDSIDKKDIMIKYNFDIILDYYIPIPKKRQSVPDEVNEFFNYLRVRIDPKFYSIIESVTYEYRNMLFGKGKSIKTKIEELTAIMDASTKSVHGTLRFINKLMTDNKSLESSNYGDK